MKRFLFGRLHAEQNGYDYYIPPIHPVGDIELGIRSDLLASKPKYVFLQSSNGRITIAVREQLTLKDAFGRLRENCMGYQLEAHESAQCIPFFDAIQAKLPEITEEAHRCHEVLDADHLNGKRMNETRLQFAEGTFQKGHAWDDAVMKLRENPNAEIKVMIDADGKNMTKTLEAIIDRFKKPASTTVAKSLHENIVNDSTVSAENIVTKGLAAKIGMNSAVKVAMIGGSVLLVGVLGYWMWRSKQKKHDQEELLSR